MELVATVAEAVIAREGSERGDLFVRPNWTAFAPHAFARIFCDTCHRYAVLGWEVGLVATNMSPLRGFHLVTCSGSHIANLQKR